MENSILTSTKKMLGLAEEYEAFDLDIITHINATFSVLDQMGVGPSGGVYAIDSKEYSWYETGIPPDQMQLIRTYMFLKVRLLFDPPTTGFLLEALKSQILEMEVRLNIMREFALPDPTPPPEVEV